MSREQIEQIVAEMRAWSTDYTPVEVDEWADRLAALSQPQAASSTQAGSINGRMMLAAQASLKAAGADLPSSVIRDALTAALASSTTPGSTHLMAEGEIYRKADVEPEIRHDEFTPCDASGNTATRAPVVDDAMLESWRVRYNELIRADRTYEAEQVLRCINDAKQAALAQPAQQGERE